MVENVRTIIPPQQLWQMKFPSIISSIFSFIQFAVTVAIIGCEVGSMLIDVVTATIYVGLWASIFFLIASISQIVSCMLLLFFFYFNFIELFFFVACCCQTRIPATYT